MNCDIIKTGISWLDESTDVILNEITSLIRLDILGGCLLLKAKINNFIRNYGSEPTKYDFYCQLYDNLVCLALLYKNNRGNICD